MEEKKEHPDVEYIKRPDIGVVIAKGLAVLYKTKPSNPCDYLGKWLHNYAAVEKKKQEMERRQEKVQEL